MAIFALTKIGLPNLVGWIADHNASHHTIVRVFALVLLFVFLGFFWAHTYWEFVVVILLYSSLWACLIPQYGATTVKHLGQELHRYGAVRVWGSIGFILTALVLGWSIKRYGIYCFLPITFILVVGSAVCFFLLPKTVHTEMDTNLGKSVWNVLKQKEVSVFFLSVFLIFFSYAPYGTFFSIYLQDYGYGPHMIGFFWAVSLIAEMGVFLVAFQWTAKWGVKTLLLISFLSTGIRWLLIGYGVEYWGVLMLAQTLHAFSFGLLHITAIQLIARFFKTNHLVQGQALMSSIGFGLGNTLGSFVSGFSWQHLGAENTFLWAAAIAFLSFMITWRLMAPEKL